MGRGGDGDGEEVPMDPHVVLPRTVKSISTATESSESSLHAIASMLLFGSFVCWFIAKSGDDTFLRASV
eukprot:scaffold36118_cov48-Attheya_sp.AAC.1